MKFMQMGSFEINNLVSAIDVQILAPHTIVLSIIAIPIFDMLSVFVLRILSKQSPFHADRRHTHHRLLTLGLSQRQTVLVILLANISIILFAYFVQGTGAAGSLLYTMLYCAFLQVVLIWSCRHKPMKIAANKECPTGKANITRV
jgi:amino acid transporter